MKTMKFNYPKICLVALLFLSVGSFTACKDDDDNNEQYVMTNQDFVNSASSANSFEIASGALAVSKGVNADVKHYGEHMVTDHTTAGVEMKNLATQKGWTIPTALMQKEQQNLDKLNGLSGDAFDKEFVNIMVTSHQETVALFTTAASPMGVPDGDLRSMANGKLPTLQAHLQEAVALKAKVNP